MIEERMSSGSVRNIEGHCAVPIIRSRRARKSTYLKRSTKRMERRILEGVRGSIGYVSHILAAFIVKQIRITPAPFEFIISWVSTSFGP